jgi:RES domain-containing protein
MMVYRVGKTKWARDLKGEGSRLFGGRWNHQLTPCIYSSESRALALLEYTVNINLDDIPRSLSLTSYEISKNWIGELSQEILPGNWKDSPAPSSTKNFGTSLLQDPSTFILKIPSSLIIEEFNFVINPLHAEISQVRILDIRDFVYDVRIKG